MLILFKLNQPKTPQLVAVVFLNSYFSEFQNDFSAVLISNQIIPNILTYQINCHELLSVVKSKTKQQNPMS
jgi:hypothetical protein